MPASLMGGMSVIVGIADMRAVVDTLLAAPGGEVGELVERLRHEIEASYLPSPVQRELMREAADALTRLAGGLVDLSAERRKDGEDGKWWLRNYWKGISQKIDIIRS
jgi:hypothetical protein